MRRPPKKADVEALGFRLPFSVMRAFMGFYCMLALLMLQAVAEQPKVQAKEKGRQQDRGADTRLLRTPWQAHRTAAFPSRQKKYAGTVTVNAPFIRPIAPMQPLFPKDDLLRLPWSSFGFRRTPVRFRSRPFTAPHQVRLKPQAELHTDPLPSTVSADRLTSLAHLISERTMPLRQSSPASEPLSSSAILQTNISLERATQIQTALVRYGYLAGTPTGSWDTTSIAAMRRLQSDHRWQTKLMPDARALIFLGLGPGSEAP